MSNADSILIVDDIPANLSLMSEILSKEGYDVAVATSGEMALKVVENNPPNLILLDVMMPGVDGFEMCQKLRTITSVQNVPIIFMTAMAEVKYRIKGLSLGAVDYIPKSLQYDEVIARIKAHLALPRHNLQIKTFPINCSDEYQQIDVKNAWQHKLKRVYKYIEENISEDLSVDTVAEVADMGACYFATIFKKSTGLTLHQYITRHRINKAKQLLSDLDIPISEVYQIVGFKNQSHFTRAFHKYTQITPKVYRDSVQTI